VVLDREAAGLVQAASAGLIRMQGNIRADASGAFLKELPIREANKLAGKLLLCDRQT